MTQASERAKIVHALDRSVTVNGPNVYGVEIFNVRYHTDEAQKTV
jgi:hypothetical protein